MVIRALGLTDWDVRVVVLLKADFARWWGFHGNGVASPRFLDALHEGSNAPSLVGAPGYLGKTVLIGRDRGEIRGFTIWSSVQERESSRDHATNDAVKFAACPGVIVDPFTVYEVLFANSRLPGRLPSEDELTSMRARVSTLRGGSVTSEETLSTLDRYFADSEAQRPGALVTCMLCDRDETTLIVVTLFADERSLLRSDVSATEDMASVAAATGAEAVTENFEVLAYEQPLTWHGA